ncbi:hypothetical protein [Kurthia zopfii]|uniref:hypothetical protein n=1 Tax=Kurthia zopfii TaxID=1650 RepID=UPI000E1BDD46|nr:hypothetical protein [Kurthia zopfii]
MYIVIQAFLYIFKLSFIKSKELNKKIVKSLEEIERLSKKLSKDKDNVKLSILIKEKEIKYLKLQQKLDSKKKKKKKKKK